MRRGRFSVFALKNDKVEQYRRSFWGRITNLGSKAKEITKYHESCVSVVGFSACVYASEEERIVRDVV